jgi:hypothetical protein
VSPFSKDVTNDIDVLANLTPQEQIKKIRYELVKNKFSYFGTKGTYNFKKQMSKYIRDDKLKFFHLSSKSPLEQVTTKLFFNQLIDNTDYMVNIKNDNEKQLKLIIAPDSI